MVDDGNAGRIDRDAEVSGRVPSRAVEPDAGLADGRHLPAALAGTAAAERGHRRRTARAARLRRLPGQGGAVRAHRRIPARGAATVDLATAGHLCGRTHPGRGRATEQPARPDTRGVLRRLLGVGRTGGRQALRRLSHLGRTADRGRQEAGLGPRAGRRRGANPAVRLADSRDQPRHLGRGVGRGRPAAVGDRPGRHRAGAGQPGAQRVRGPAPDAGAARRQQRQTACRPEPVGRGRPGARGSGHRPGRLARRGRRAAGRIRQTGHHPLHPVGVSASGRGLLVRRGRAAAAGADGVVGHPNRRSRPAATTPFAVASAH